MKRSRRPARSLPGPVLVAAAAALVAGGLLPSTAVAQDEEEPPPPPPPPAGPTRAPGDKPVPVDPSAEDFRGAVLGDLTDGRDVGGERVIRAVGGTSQPIWIKLEGFELRCDSVVLWGDREQLEETLRRRKTEGDLPATAVLGPVLHAVYAEGHVYVRRDSHTIHAERVFLDFAQNRAYVVDARVQGTHEVRKGAEAPLVIRALVVRGIAKDRFVAENGSLTSCTYDHPHLEFTSDRVEVDFSEGRQSFDTGWGTTVRADTPFGEGLPVFLLPRLGGDFGSYPLQTIELGNSNRYGTYFGLGFGGRLRREDDSVWGDWKVVPRWRSDRGVGLEAGIDHESLPARAGGPADRLSLDGTYQADGQDEDEYSDRPFDGEVGGDTPNDRGNVHLRWRHHLENGPLAGLLGRGWDLDAEVAYWSDRGFLPEYEQDAALTDKQQETFARLSKSWGTSALSILGTTRLPDESVALVRRTDDLFLTDYATQTDSVSATWHLVNHPLLRQETTGLVPVNLSLQAGAGTYERNWDDVTEDFLETSSGWTSERVLRGDAEGRVTLPFEVGPVQVTPAFGGSLLAVDEANGYAQAGTDATDDAEARSAAFYALRVGSEAHRTFEASSEILDLDGLRHVISPEAQWFHRFHVSEDAGTFQSNDLVDELDEENVVSLRLRNRLQTKRDGETVDWLDYEARFLWYADETEATGGSLLGLREDLAQPLQRLDFAGEDKYLRRTREGSAFHQHRARMQLTRTLWLMGEADYDMQLNDLETTGVGARWFANRRFSVYVGRRTIDEDSTIWTLRGDYVMSQRWAFAGEFQQDTETDRGLRTRVGLYRRSHDLTIAVEFESEKLLEETNLSFVVYPHDWMARGDDPFSKRRPLDFDALRWYR